MARKPNGAPSGALDVLFAAVNAMNDEEYKKFRDGLSVIHQQRQQRKLLSLSEDQVIEFDTRGRTIRAKIDSFGPKRIAAYELDKDGNKTHVRWRVSPGLVRVVS